jgi:RNA polymerase sigma-70 factor (family 1)
MIALPGLTAYNEKELLLRLSGGDESALTQIYILYWKPIFIHAYNVLKDKMVCEDIVQDIFMQLWRKRSTLHITDTLGGYLFAATRYQVFDVIRRSPHKYYLFDNIEERMYSPSADQATIEKDLQQHITNEVSKLPEKCRLIYKLSREEYLPHKEIAEKLQISIKTVENQLTIALRRLRLSLRDGMLLLFFFS